MDFPPSSFIFPLSPNGWYFGDSWKSNHFHIKQLPSAALTIRYPLSYTLHCTLTPAWFGSRWAEAFNWSLTWATPTFTTSQISTASHKLVGLGFLPWLHIVLKRHWQHVFAKKKVSAFSKLWKKSLDLMVISGNYLSTNSCPKQTHMWKKHRPWGLTWRPACNAWPNVGFFEGQLRLSNQKKLRPFQVDFCWEQKDSTTESAEFQHKSGWLSHMAGHLAQGGRSPCLAGLI